MERRKLLSRLAGLSVFGIGSANAQAPVKQKLKIMMRGGWGTDDPTRAAFVFAHALALSDAGHDVQVFLTGEATYLMRKSTVEAVKPIGWPPLTELRDKAVAGGLRVFS
jgi:predicted peroxiredoxin